MADCNGDSHEGTISEFTYEALDLYSSDEDDFDFVESNDVEEDYNAFFSAEPQELRNKVVMNPENTTRVSRDRKWTVYDLTSAKFLPTNHPTDITKMMNRCAPMKMMFRVCDIFTNTPTPSFILLLSEYFPHIEYEDRSQDPSTILVPPPFSRESFKHFMFTLANKLNDEFLLEHLNEFIEDEHELPNVLKKLLVSEYMKKSVVLRLIRASAVDLTEPMLTALGSRVASKQIVKRNKTTPSLHSLRSHPEGTREKIKKKKKKTISYDTLIPLAFQTSVSSASKVANVARSHSEHPVPPLTNLQADLKQKSEPRIHFSGSVDTSSPKPTKKKTPKLSPRKRKTLMKRSSDAGLSNKEIKLEGEALSPRCETDRGRSSERTLKSPRKTKSKSPGRFHSIMKKKESNNEAIYLSPQISTEHVHILQCDDGSFILRHRRKENATSLLFPCPLEIDWQAEFVLNETGTNLLSMFPKIVGLTFTDEKMQEKWEGNVLALLEERLFS